MKKIIRWTLLAVFAITSTSLSAAVDMFIKFDDVPGEAIVKGESGWIGITEVKGLPEATGKAATRGPRAKKQVTVVKAVDKSTPKLAEAVAGTRRADKATPKLAEARARSERPRAPITLDDGERIFLFYGGRVVSSTVKGEVETVVISYESIEVKESAPAAAPAVDYNSSRSNSR